MSAWLTIYLIAGLVFVLWWIARENGRKAQDLSDAYRLVVEMIDVAEHEHAHFQDAASARILLRQRHLAELHREVKLAEGRWVSGR